MIHYLELLIVKLLDAARKFVLRLLNGSGSKYGNPVAEVVVLQVAVDIRRSKLGGILLDLCQR